MVAALDVRRSHPQRFSDVVGQDDAVDVLRKNLLGDHSSRAFLLHGPSSSGKRSLARVFSKALLCPNRAVNGEPCCDCESCCLVQQAILTDARETGVERVDWHPGTLTVHLLNGAHMMPAAFEREFAQSVDSRWDDDQWVLITTEPHRIPYAVRRRCELVQTRLIDAETMTDHLQGVLGEADLELSDEAVALAVAVGAGSMESARTALEAIADETKGRGGRSRLNALVERLGRSALRRRSGR